MIVWSVSEIFGAGFIVGVATTIFAGCLLEWLLKEKR